MIDFSPSPIELLFWNALALMAAACLFAPIFRKLRLGTVLGYLTAGLVVQLIFHENFSEHPEELLHFAEFGVVLFLFVIGLELKPSTLWAMRTDIFGLGLAQMTACGVLLAGGAWALGLGIAPAVVVGLGLALSSTALVMQSLEERRERATLAGRKTFSILLFQDIAIVPLLLLVTLLAPSGDSLGLTDSLTKIALALAAIALLVVVGRFVLDPMFRVLAKTGMPEIMTASALGIVIASALLMDLVGMSYGMGAFIAGVMLAESAYRHEVEANIEPFRGLFLGLFFMAVGLSLDLGVVLENAVAILVLAPAAMLIKGIAIFAVARAVGLTQEVAVKLALALPQFGEFAFVLLSAASAALLLDGGTASVLVAIVTVSMALSPLVQKLETFWSGTAAEETMEESFHDAGGQVLVIGFGRFGQVVSQPLFARGLETTILESNPTRVREAATFGFRIHFGDGTRRDVLRAAGAGTAQLIVICVDDADAADRILSLAKTEFSQAKVLVRSFDRRHSVQLFHAGADYSVRETFESALNLGKHALTAIGMDEPAARAIIADVRARDRDRLRQQVHGDMSDGSDRLHTAPLKPEPLPKREEET